MENYEFSSSTRVWLLEWARQSIDHFLRESEESAPEPLPEQVMLQRGAFVSLHKRGGDLRGCIGTFESLNPLWVTIRELAISAATCDPRFRPLKADELRQCDIEISILSAKESISVESIEVGKHGLWVSQGHRRGVLLPQVAISRGWNSKQFLEQTCVKAGLSPNAWMAETTKIEAFRAEVFAESCD